MQKHEEYVKHVKFYSLNIAASVDSINILRGLWGTTDDFTTIPIKVLLGLYFMMFRGLNSV